MNRVPISFSGYFICDTQKKKLALELLFLIALDSSIRLALCICPFRVAEAILYTTLLFLFWAFYIFLFIGLFLAFGFDRCFPYPYRFQFSFLVVALVYGIAWFIQSACLAPLESVLLPVLFFFVFSRFPLVMFSGCRRSSYFIWFNVFLFISISNDLVTGA